MIDIGRYLWRKSMLKVFDSVLASSDMSLERVLKTGLPVAIIFYEKELSAQLRGTMDELASQYAGKVLIVMLARADALQAVARFGVRQFPSLVTVRDGKTLEKVEGVQTGDLSSYIAYLLGVGPRPILRIAPQPQAASKSGATRKPVAVSERDFEGEVLHSDRPVLVDFWAPWCAPCRMVAPALESLARDHGEALKVVKVNVDENPGLAGKYGAMSIPTMIVIKGGREVDRWVGAMPEPAIRSRAIRWI
jgi:thioredoxin 1